MATSNTLTTTANLTITPIVLCFLSCCVETEVIVQIGGKCLTFVARAPFEVKLLGDTHRIFA